MICTFFFFLFSVMVALYWWHGLVGVDHTLLIDFGDENCSKLFSTKFFFSFIDYNDIQNYNKRRIKRKTNREDLYIITLFCRNNGFLMWRWDLFSSFCWRSDMKISLWWRRIAGSSSLSLCWFKSSSLSRVTWYAKCSLKSPHRDYL